MGSDLFLREVQPPPPGVPAMGTALAIFFDPTTPALYTLPKVRSILNVALPQTFSAITNNMHAKMETCRGAGGKITYFWRPKMVQNSVFGSGGHGSASPTPIRRQTYVQPVVDAQVGVAGWPHQPVHSLVFFSRMSMNITALLYRCTPVGVLFCFAR